jgi:hypothetical protein
MQNNFLKFSQAAQVLIPFGLKTTHSLAQSQNFRLVAALALSLCVSSVPASLNSLAVS